MKLALNFNPKLIFLKNVETRVLSKKTSLKWTLSMVLKFSTNWKEDLRRKRFTLFYGILWLLLILLNWLRKITVLMHCIIIMNKYFLRSIQTSIMLNRISTPLYSIFWNISKKRIWFKCWVSVVNQVQEKLKQTNNVWEQSVMVAKNKNLSQWSTLMIII